MKTVIRILLLVTLIGGGVWLWMYFHPGPEEIIRCRLAEVAWEVSFSADEGMVAKAVHADEDHRYEITPKNYPAILRPKSRS